MARKVDEAPDGTRVVTEDFIGPTCQCLVAGCHCNGIADLAEYGHDRCSCCIADCPDVHDQPSIAPALGEDQRPTA